MIGDERDEGMIGDEESNGMIGDERDEGMMGDEGLLKVGSGVYIRFGILVRPVLRGPFYLK